jgi:hypothetical protein
MGISEQSSTDTIPAIFVVTIGHKIDHFKAQQDDIASSLEDMMALCDAGWVHKDRSVFLTF